MLTQNYVYYIFGFEEIWLKVRARAFWEKMRLFDSKSLIALEQFFLTLVKQIWAKKIHLQRLKCPRPRAIKENIFEYLCA